MTGLSEYSHLISSVYHKLLNPKVLSLPIIESKATCGACIQVPRYENHLKCCTFHPFLPNYLVGKILLEEQESPSFISNVMKHKISNRVYALPIGITAPISYQVDFNKYKDKKFGKNPDWLCPYYNLQNQNCGIWENKGSVCTSFYCESSKGKKGKVFWEKSLNYLSYIEMAFAEEALVNLDFSPRQVSEQLDFLNRKKATREELKQDYLDAKLDQKLWNHYTDKQAFYIKCYEIVKKMERPAVQELMGDLGEKLENDFLKSGAIWSD